MKTNKEQAYKKIARLVERFNEHVEEYKRDGYNEHQTRVDYINPFFKALGWDMDNEQGYAEAYREVIHENKIKVGSSTKAPDYGFTLFGQRKFFVDAKKPAIDIKSDLAPAYQVRRYGWSAKVPISIVTDFEEFSIYDCTKKPKTTDKPSVARIKYITYDKYLDEFDFLWDVFAKENLPKGRFDKYVQSDTRRKGTATVDDEFLKSIEQWRTYLATTIALRNKSLNEDEINYAVQKIIDRILFLRMCEDRGVEQYGELKKAAVKGDIYQNLFALYRMADDRYNSGLFDFKEDKITPALIVDNKVMKNIIKELYYPNCEYEFSVMPADILGSVYEQFLGKTIRLTKAHYAKVEEKPEVRKAGGVYYTPKYIVDYIVENTVGKLIEGKTPKQVDQIKICDPACGSGSFLIGAYQYLLDWHMKYYTDNPPKKKKESPLTPDGNLTTAEKKRILLNNIFGVDIDAQAVEVTKLNLLLKALEGETQASISQQLALFQERVLPNLGSNIKCGNSLIGPDFYDDQLDLFPEQMKKINAFDWEMGFPEIFQQGGFDAVIGNPPYIRSKLLEKNQREYFEESYTSPIGTYDIYILFIEKGMDLLKAKGLLAFINPNKYFYADYGSNIREILSNHYQINSVLDFNEYQIFKGITTYTTVNIFKKSKPKKSFCYAKVKDKKIQQAEIKQHLSNVLPHVLIQHKKVAQKFLGAKSWSFVDEHEAKFKEKIYSKSTALIDYCYKIYQGFVLTPTEVFPVSIEKELKNIAQIKPIKKDETIYPFERELLVQIIKSSSIHKYSFSQKNYFSVFPYKYLLDNSVELIEPWELKRKYPKALAYLETKSRYLKTREKGKWKNSPHWYEYSRKQNFECQKMEKILVPGLATHARYTLASADVFIDQGSYGIILKPKFKKDELFFLGLLNSKLLDYFLKSSSGTLSGGYYSYQTKYLSNLPIINYDLNNSSQKPSYLELTTLVKKIIQLTQLLQTTTLETQQQQIQRTIDHTEKKIDELVYGLYGLSEEEIKTVEEVF